MFSDEIQNLCFLFGFGVFGYRQVVEFDIVVLGEGSVFWVVRDDERYFDVKLVGFYVEEQVIKVVVDFGDYNENFCFFSDRVKVVFYFIFGGKFVEWCSQVGSVWFFDWVKVYMYEEMFRCRIRELLQVENIVLLLCEDVGDGVDDVRFVWVGQCQDVIVGYVEEGVFKVGLKIGKIISLMNCRMK